jgi:hypothetical protein
MSEHELCVSGSSISRNLDYYVSTGSYVTPISHVHMTAILVLYMVEN